MVGYARKKVVIAELDPRSRIVVTVLESTASHTEQKLRNNR